MGKKRACSIDTRAATSLAHTIRSDGFRSLGLISDASVARPLGYRRSKGQSRIRITGRRVRNLGETGPALPQAGRRPAPCPNYWQTQRCDKAFVIVS